MSYWDDIEKYEEKQQRRLLEAMKKEHEYKMKELKKEVELFIKKENARKGDVKT